MTTDRSYVRENEVAMRRLRELVEALDEERLATPMDAGWTVAAVLAKNEKLGLVINPFRAEHPNEHLDDLERALGGR